MFSEEDDDEDGDNEDEFNDEVADEEEEDEEDFDLVNNLIQIFFSLLSLIWSLIIVVMQMNKNNFKNPLVSNLNISLHENQVVFYFIVIV